MKRLVFLHGWGYTPALWERLRPELTGFELHMPRLAPANADLAAWADALAPDLPDACLLVGWSLGAMLAMQVAARHPHKVCGLFLIGASPCFVAREDWKHGLAANTVTAFRAGFSKNPERTLQRFLALQVLGDAQRHALMPQLEAALVAAETPNLEAGLQILEEVDLRTLKMPANIHVHLLHGAQDALMPLKAAQWLHERLPNTKLTIIEDAGHAALLAQPAALAAHIRTLVDAA